MSEQGAGTGARFSTLEVSETSVLNSQIKLVKHNLPCLKGKQTGTGKSARNCRVCITLQNMISLLVLVHFSIVTFIDLSQKVPLLDVEGPAKFYANLFRVIYEIFNEVILEFDRQGI